MKTYEDSEIGVRIETPDDVDPGLVSEVFSRLRVADGMIFPPDWIVSCTTAAVFRLESFYATTQ